VPHFQAIECGVRRSTPQQALANAMAWDKSCLSHQLTRMQETDLLRARKQVQKKLRTK